MPLCLRLSVMVKASVLMTLKRLSVPRGREIKCLGNARPCLAQ